VGDRVDHDGTRSVVEDVIDTPERQRHWGVKEPGLMIASDKYGRIFQPVRSVDWDAVVLVSRRDDSE
jgi:hypothetical protein